MITTAEYQRTEREIALHAGKKGWTVHVAVYAVVMTGLVVLNLLIAARTESNFIWFPFPLVGWGIGRTMHYLHGVRWADREIRARQARIEGMASSPGERRP